MSPWDMFQRRRRTLQRGRVRPHAELNARNIYVPNSAGLWGEKTLEYTINVFSLTALLNESICLEKSALIWNLLKHK